MSNTLQKDQRGLVSFMITIIMMLVISLIVMGFTQVTNRNRREQLDRQLSAQAFYAAESGVNDAITKINGQLAENNPVDKQTSCTGNKYLATPLSPTSPDVGYTCVLVNPLPPEITTSANSKTSSVVNLDLKDSNGNNFPTANKLDLTFTWSVATGGNAILNDPGKCPAILGTLPTKNFFCRYALLRVDLMKMGGGALSATGSPPSLAATLADDTVTYYMKPTLNPGVIPEMDDFASPKAYLVAAACDNVNKTCTGTISLIRNAKTTNYYARISTLYQDTPRLVIDGKNSNGDSAYFANAQAIIDVTGKAVDVLRRVKVTVPLQSRDSTLIPQAAVQSTATVCKRFSTYTGYFSPVDGCTP